MRPAVAEGDRGGRMVRTLAWALTAALIAVVLVFVVLRLVIDAVNISSGAAVAPEDFAQRYAAFPWLAYAHIVPGVVYLAIAPFQLWRGSRTRHLGWHRRMGRVAVTAGIVAGVFGIVFGLLLPFGGALEASAAAVFGAWFVVALVVAFRSIRRGDMRRHRRFMIRAFAVGVAVGTIRLWVGLFEASGLFEFREGFGVAFWLSFLMHAAAAELWLWWWSRQRGSTVVRARVG